MDLQVVGDICDPFAAMPFTFAHPAAILPLRRSRFLQTVPLIIGSLVPDVPYYFPGRLMTRIFLDTHTLHGSIFICLPLGHRLADTDPALARAADGIARCPRTVRLFAIHRALQ